MAEDSRLGGQLLGDAQQLFVERLAFASPEDGTAIGLEEMLYEELQLPRQLLDVERDPVGEIAVGHELAPTLLHLHDQRDRLPVERRMLCTGRGAEMRL